MDKAQTGKNGEDQACRFLQERGHTILERNWRTGHLEVDIISKDGDGVHIVEVKTRTLPAPAAPEANVDAKKQARLLRAAYAWLASAREKGLRGAEELFFDVIAVEFTRDGELAGLQYYPQAFIPMNI